MQLIKLILATFCLALIGMNATAEAKPRPSFNCAKARAPIEVAICSDSRLAASDAAMAKLYKLARNALGGSAGADARKALKDAQRRWLRARRFVCGMRSKGKWLRNADDIACLRAMYVARQADLSAGLAQTNTVKPDGVCSIQGRTDSGATVSCRFALGQNRGRPAMTLTQVGEAADLRIAFPGTSADTQDIRLNEAVLVMPDGAPSGIVFADFNFDGYTDFSVVQFLPAGPNIPSSFVLYDPKQGGFALHERLGEITSPTFDPRTRTVSSIWRGSAAQYGRDLFRWETGNLVRVLTMECRIGDRGEMTVRIGEGNAIKRAAPSIEDCLSAVQAD